MRPVRRGARGDRLVVADRAARGLAVAGDRRAQHRGRPRAAPALVRAHPVVEIGNQRVELVVSVGKVRRLLNEALGDGAGGAVPVATDLDDRPARPRSAPGCSSFLSPCVLPLVPAYIGQLSAVAVVGRAAGTPVALARAPPRARVRGRVRRGVHDPRRHRDLRRGSARSTTCRSCARSAASSSSCSA